jgi:hypothetical protein
MFGEEQKLLDYFRKLSPANKQLVLANIRLVSVTESTVKEAVLAELGIAQGKKGEREEDL